MKQMGQYVNAEEEDGMGKDSEPFQLFTPCAVEQTT